MKRAAGVLLRDHEGRILILRRSGRMNNPGLWNLPGGRADPGELPLTTALRELAEETGIILPLGLARLWGSIDGPGKVYSVFVATIPEPVAVTVNDESDASAWVTPDEAVYFDLHPGLEALLEALDSA